MSDEITTCQICARPIKAKNGIIAHHGYKRPNRGSGWQTASCAGARFLPYEVSCDRLPPTIVTIKNFIMLKDSQLREFIDNPPESLKINLGGYYTTSTREVTRPDEFDYKSVAFSFASMRPNTYENEFRDRMYNIEQDIKFAKIDLKFMEERLENWTHRKILI